LSCRQEKLNRGDEKVFHRLGGNRRGRLREQRNSSSPTLATVLGAPPERGHTVPGPLSPRLQNLPVGSQRLAKGRAPLQQLVPFVQQLRVPHFLVTTSRGGSSKTTRGPAARGPRWKRSGFPVTTLPPGPPQ
jgi:hypothetical protein